MSCWRNKMVKKWLLWICKQWICTIPEANHEHKFKWYTKLDCTLLIMTSIVCDGPQFNNNIEWIQFVIVNKSINWLKIFFFNCQVKNQKWHSCVWKNTSAHFVCSWRSDIIKNAFWRDAQLQKLNYFFNLSIHATNGTQKKRKVFLGALASHH